MEKTLALPAIKLAGTAKSTAKRPAAKKTAISRTTRLAKRPKAPTLAELKRRLFADPERLLRLAEAHTILLTGRPRL